MHTNSPHDGAVYTGHLVADEHGHEIGRVVDVIDDDATTDWSGADRRPSWLVVDLGFLRGRHDMPVAGTYRMEDGTIVTPWDKGRIKSAVKAGGDHILTSEQRTELAGHYAIPARPFRRQSATGPARPPTTGVSGHVRWPSGRPIAA